MKLLIYPKQNKSVTIRAFGPSGEKPWIKSLKSEQEQDI